MKCFVKLIYIVCMSAYNTEHILVPGKILHNAFTREKRITKVSFCACNFLDLLGILCECQHVCMQLCRSH